MTAMFVLLTMAISAIATMATEAIKRVVNTSNKWVNLAIAWIIPIALTYAAWFIGYMPVVSQPDWLWVLIEGVIVGAVSTKAYDASVVKKIYDWIFSWINGEKWYNKIEPSQDGDFMKAVESICTNLQNGTDKIGDIKVIAKNLLELARKELGKEKDNE